MVKDADISAKEIPDAIGNSLSRGDRVELRGFGSFRGNVRPARRGCNPRSGEAVHVAEEYVPRFTAGKEVRERIDQAVQ